MDLTVHGSNILVTDALRTYAEKKLGKLQRYWKGVNEAQVLLEVERGQHICEVTVPLTGAVLRGEARADDMYQAIDECVQKLERQIQRYKARFDRASKELGELLTNESEPGDEIVRQKKFPAKPMQPEEAVMQLNLIGHDFFVFTNAETDRISVIYRRRDGRYGLLEPDM